MKKTRDTSVTRERVLWLFVLLLTIVIFAVIALTTPLALTNMDDSHSVSITTTQAASDTSDGTRFDAIVEIADKLVKEKYENSSTASNSDNSEGSRFEAYFEAFEMLKNEMK